MITSHVLASTPLTAEHKIAEDTPKTQANTEATCNAERLLVCQRRVTSTQYEGRSCYSGSFKILGLNKLLIKVKKVKKGKKGTLTSNSDFLLKGGYYI